MYPLKMIPYYRHGDETPWGGRALKDLFGKDIPDDRTGESLEISALGEMQSRVSNGELAGRTLGEAVGLWGEALTGPLGPDGRFPLMLKLLDAREMLSVQVHPDDGYALKNDGKLGKTEAWVVLSCPYGSQLVYGLCCGAQELSGLCEQGRFEEALRRVTVAPGDVLYIPHGLVHALGGGIIVYEIQQSSDATYRVWDWGRVGSDGKPRALHTRKALDVIRPDLAPDKLPGATLLCAGGSRTAYIADENFELWRLNVAGTMRLEKGRMRFVTPLGPTVMRYEGGELEIAPLESVLVPAALEVSVEGRLSCLLSTTPDQAALREALGYRAQSVAGLTAPV